VNVAINSDNILCCPKCRGENLHQGTVEVFNRPQEDALSLAVLVRPGYGPKTGDPNRNPSDRRQGLSVGFWCETCEAESGPDHETLKLQIWQHKGITFIRWEE
jgi:hypothetical protein